MGYQLIHQDLESRVLDVAISTGANGRWFSSWLIDGKPGRDAAPAAIAIPTNANGLRHANAGVGKELWLASMQAASLAQSYVLFLSDRLLHVGGLSANSTGLQEFASGAVTYVDRDPTPTGDGLGIGNELWVEITAIIGATARDLTITYKDADDATQTATVSIGGTGRRDPAQLLSVPLANDRGVRGITSCQLGTGTGTVGDFAIVVAHRLANHYAGLSTPQQFCAVHAGFAPVRENACLWAHFLQLGSAITAANVLFQAQYALVDH